jgi:hypothetical protein
MVISNSYVKLPEGRLEPKIRHPKMVLAYGEKDGER